MFLSKNNDYVYWHKDSDDDGCHNYESKNFEKLAILAKALVVMNSQIDNKILVDSIGINPGLSKYSIP